MGIIPARKGSKGVTNKNLRKLGDKPLVAYTINASLNSKINRTIVSTDSEEIASIAKQYGAEVPFIRPSELATDKATAISVVLHCLDYLSKNEHYNPDLVAYLEPTAPFRTSKHIDEAINLLMKSFAESVAGISQVVQHPYWMFSRNNNGKLKEFLHLKNKPERRQDFPLLYWVNCLYITRKRYFDHVKPYDLVFNTNSVVGLVMDKISAFDINDETDFRIAETILKSGLFSPMF